MSQRLLLTSAVGLLAAAAVLGGVGAATGRLGAQTYGESGALTSSLDQAQSRVQAYLDRLGNKDLKIDEVMDFDQNFYAVVKENGTGIGAFELLVNKQTGAVSPEPGPNMMWNSKYGSTRGGMMGVLRSSGAMTVSAEQATAIAQPWLAQRGPGYSAGIPDAFHGYYTLHFERDGKVAGMLSVNGQTGAVWLHSWHGNFISSKQVNGS